MPNEVWPVIHTLWDTWRGLMFGPYGFTDGMNVGRGWFDTDVLGIDQGPILIMIENYRTGSVWNRFMQNPEITTGLTRAGFNAVTTDVPQVRAGTLALAASPNPSHGGTSLRFSLPQDSRVHLAAFDVTGREVARLIDGAVPAGDHVVRLEDQRWRAGVYLYRLTANGVTTTARGVKLP